MLMHLAEEGKFVEITGFRNVQIQDMEDFLDAVREKMPHDTELQLFDADLIASWKHIYFAVLSALMAFRTGRNISKSIAVEVVLYASAQRQIKKAIELIGVKKSTENVAVLIISGRIESSKAGLTAIIKYMGTKPDETVIHLSKEKLVSIKRAFNISNIELNAVSTKDNAEQAIVDIVTERIALLSTQL